MPNYTYHYFGAYLEIKVNKVAVINVFSGCKNGHRGTGRFCGECGASIGKKSELVEKYPTGIVYDVLGEKFTDVLSVITPQELNGTGVIIAIGNLAKPSGDWLHLGQWRDNGDPSTKEFPSYADIGKMVSDFSKNYEDIIVALKNSPIVKSVTIKTGYVLNEEY